MAKIPPFYVLISQERSAQFVLDVQGYTVMPLFSTEVRALEYRNAHGAPQDYTPTSFDDDQNIIEVLEKFSDQFDAYAIDPPVDKEKPIEAYSLGDTIDIIRERANR